MRLCGLTRRNGNTGLSDELLCVWSAKTLVKWENIDLNLFNVMLFFQEDHIRSHIWLFPLTQHSWHSTPVIVPFPLPWWLSGKESTCQCRRGRFNPWVGKIPWRRKWQLTPVFLPGKFHGQRSLVGYSPCGHKESDTTEWACTHAKMNVGAEVATWNIYNGEGRFDKVGMKFHARRTTKLVSALSLMNPALLMNWLYLLTLYSHWTVDFWMAGTTHLNFSFSFVLLAISILQLNLFFYWVLKLNRFGLEDGFFSSKIM